MRACVRACVREPNASPRQLSLRLENRPTPLPPLTCPLNPTPLFASPDLRPPLDADAFEDDTDGFFVAVFSRPPPSPAAAAASLEVPLLPAPERAAGKKAALGGPKNKAGLKRKALAAA